VSSISAKLAAVATVVAVWLALPAAAAAIEPGFDLFETDPGATAFAFNDEFTIPAGFFGQGSRPFSGVVRFGGDPLKRFQGKKTGDADTIVQRPQAAGVSPGTSATVPVELVALSLVSIQPIRVTFDNGSSRLFDVSVHLSPNRPSQGSATVSETSANGGTMSSGIVVFPIFTFVPQGGGPKRTIDVGTLPLSSASLQRITLHATNTPWRAGCAPPALPIPGLNDGFCPGFTPDEHKQLSVEDAQAARHGIEPVQPRLEHFKCYSVSPRTPFRPRVVQLRDQFGAVGARVLRPVNLCAPVRKNNEPVDNQQAHLKCYAIRTAASRPQFVFTRNQFGSEVLRVGSAQELCVPSVKQLASSRRRLRLNPATLTDHFECYSASGRFKSTKVGLRDQFGSERVKVLQPVRLCNPVQKNGVPIQHPVQHLVCYSIKDLGGRFRARLVRVRNQFGTEIVAAVSPRTLCVPSLKVPADLPLPQYPFVPPPTFNGNCAGALQYAGPPNQLQVRLQCSGTLDGFTITFSGGLQVVNGSSPTGFNCAHATTSGPNDTWSCAGHAEAGALEQLGLQMSGNVPPGSGAQGQASQQTPQGTATATFTYNGPS
jgi:hypothetical protein